MNFTSPLKRTDPPDASSELAALNSWLDYHRATLLSKLEGLTPEQGRAAHRIGMITEYARHNGHADILRELIDGVTGE